MTSFNSNHRVGMQVREEPPTKDFFAYAGNVNLEIQSTSNSTEAIARDIHVDSALSVQDLIKGKVNSSVSLTEDFVNFTFSFPKLFFSELYYTFSEEMKKSETISTESTSNSSEHSDCQKSQLKGTSNCTNMNTYTNEDLSNIHEIMENRENVTCDEFPKVGSSNDTESVEFEDAESEVPNQARSKIFENRESTCVKKTLTTTSSNLKNLDAFGNYRNAQIKLENSTAEETDDCCINTDLIESKAEVAIISEDDSQNVQILRHTNDNINIVQNNFEGSSFAKYDSAEREETRTAKTWTTGSGINHEESTNQILARGNVENINQPSFEILKIVENEESENDKCSFNDAESGKDTNSSEININFNKSKLEESQSTWLELFPLRKIKKIHAKEMKFKTLVHHTAKYFEFEIFEKCVVVKVTAEPGADISVEVVTLNSLESFEIPSTYKNTLDKEESVQNSETLLGLIDPNEECHMQSEYPDKIVNEYPNVESDSKTVKESNVEADNIPIDFRDIETDIAITEDGLEVSKESLEVYLDESIADESHAETGLKIISKSSMSLELLEESLKNEWSDYVSERTAQSSELGVVEESESEMITAEESSEAEFESSTLNESSKIKPNTIESVDFMEYDVYPAVVKDKLHGTKIREYPDVESNLLEGSAIPEGDSVPVSMNDFTTAESDTVAPTDSPKSVLNFAKEGPDSITLNATSGESRPESDGDAPDGKSKTVTEKISPRNESDMMQHCEFPYELITAEESAEAEFESSTLNESSNIKPNTIEAVDSMEYDVYPAVVKDKLHGTKISREYPDVESNLWEGSEIPEGDSVPASMNDFTTGESDTVAPTDSPMSVLSFAKEGPDSITLNVTSGESRPEADEDAPDGKSKTVTEKISPRNESDMMQPYEFLYDEPVSVLGSECPEHAIVPVSHITLQENVFPLVEVCLGDSVSETVNGLHEKQNNFENKLQENMYTPICAIELFEIKSESLSDCEEFEESDLRYASQLPECEIIKIISNKVGKIESINNISESDTDSEHSSLNLQFSPDEFENKDSKEEIHELHEVSSLHEDLAEQTNNGTEIKQNSSHKREQFTRYKLQKIGNFEVEDSKLTENDTSFLSVDPRTSSNFNTSSLKSGIKGDIDDDIASNSCDNESLSKIEVESANSEHVHEELENDIKKQADSLKRGKTTSENKVGEKVQATKGVQSNKGSKIAKGIPKVLSSNLLSDEVDTAPTRLRTKHYPPTSITKNVIPGDFQVTQDKIYKVTGKGARGQGSGDSSTNTSPVKRSLPNRSLEPTLGTSQNAKKLDSRSRRPSADTEKSTDVESYFATVTNKAQTPDVKLKEHLTVSVRSLSGKATKLPAIDRSQSAVIQKESSSTLKKKNIRTSRETVSESKAKGISISKTSTPVTARSKSTTTGENEISSLSVESETSISNISPLKSETTRDIDNCPSYISENESLSSIETESTSSEHMHELKSDIKKQVASLKRGKKPSESKVDVKVETPKKSNKGSKSTKRMPKVFSNLLSDEVDAAPTRLRTKHYPATSLAKYVIPENSQVSQGKTLNVFGKASKDKNSEGSSTSTFLLRRSLRSRSQDPTTSTSQNINKPDTLSQRSSGVIGKISKSFSQVERSVTRKKKVQTSDIKLDEHIAVATRSTSRSTRYNVLDHTQSEEIQEECNSTPKEANIRTINRIASVSKSKEGSFLRNSTASASTRSNANASTTTTRKTRRTKD